MIQHTRRAPRKRSGFTRFAWPVLVCSVVCALIPRPSYADPAGTAANPAIPDSGSIPVPSAPLNPPGTPGQGSQAVAPVATGPFASQIMAQYATLEATGEQLKQANIGLDAAKQEANRTYQAWQDALAEAVRLQQKADDAAAAAYKDAAELGPFANYANDVHQLGMLAPGLRSRSGPTGSETAAQDATRARAQADADEEAYRAALADEQALETRQRGLQNSYNQQNAVLTNLRTTNQTQIDAAEAAQAASDRQLDALFGAGTQVNGMVANPKALAAVRWAYAQATANPRKWYKFGAEGPDFFDCSGLTWASYRSTGFTLPRVAADQYHATSANRVPATQLLPGDLLFFSTTSKTDWRAVSHVAIYFGDNLMIEAAHEGTPVRVSQVWWSAFFGATRVYPAVRPAGTPPHGKPSTAPSKPSTPPSKSPTPSPTPSAPSGKPSTPPPDGTPPTDPGDPTPSTGSSSGSGSGSGSPTATPTTTSPTSSSSSSASDGPSASSSAGSPSGDGSPDSASSTS
jgi:cell wall-associated NlpC family hydrolase